MSRWLRHFGLRAVALLSLFLGVFWIVGIAYDATLGRDLPALTLLVLSASVTGAVAVAATKLYPRWLLVPAAESAAYVIVELAKWTGLAYLILVPIFGAIGVLISAAAGNRSAGDLSTAAILIGLWMPLWWAPSLGAILMWSRSVRESSA